MDLFIYTFFHFILGSFYFIVNFFTFFPIITFFVLIIATTHTSIIDNTENDFVVIYVILKDSLIFYNVDIGFTSHVPFLTVPIIILYYVVNFCYLTVFFENFIVWLVIVYRYVYCFDFFVSVLFCLLNSIIST